MAKSQQTKTQHAIEFETFDKYLQDELTADTTKSKCKKSTWSVGDQPIPKGN